MREGEEWQYQQQVDGNENGNGAVGECADVVGDVTPQVEKEEGRLCWDERGDGEPHHPSQQDENARQGPLSQPPPCDQLEAVRTAVPAAPRPHWHHPPQQGLLCQHPSLLTRPPQPRTWKRTLLQGHDSGRTSGV